MKLEVPVENLLRDLKLHDMLEGLTRRLKEAEAEGLGAHRSFSLAASRADHSRARLQTSAPARVNASVTRAGTFAGSALALAPSLVFPSSLQVALDGAR